MNSVSSHSDTCKIRQVAKNVVVEAVVQDFIPHAKLNVILNKSIKISMNWNGQEYEGKGAGMDFLSSGPAITKSYNGRR